MQTAVDYLTHETYKTSSDYLFSRLPPRLSQPDIGIVCGSGLGGLAETLTDTVSFDYKDIPHFALSTVQGHVGKLVFGMLMGKAVVCMVGRKHMYEGHQLIQTVYPIRIMKSLGVKTLVVTNAAGGLNQSYNVGDIMVISDHISFAGFGGCNALIGRNIPEFGPRFPPVSDAYDEDLRVLAFKAAHSIGEDMKCMREGTYSFVPGPSYETRAESRYLRANGADAVGMSTVPEVVIARHCGIRVLGLSLITNRVAQGLSKDCKAMALSHINGTPAPMHTDPVELVASHEEVLESGRVRSLAMQGLVSKIVDML